MCGSRKSSAARNSGVSTSRFYIPKLRLREWQGLLRQSFQLAAVSLVALGVVTAIIGATVGLISFLQTDNIPALLSKLADSLHSWQEVLPTAVAERLPASPEELRQIVIAWLPLHVVELRQAGAQAARVTAGRAFFSYEECERSRPCCSAVHLASS